MALTANDAEGHAFPLLQLLPLYIHLIQAVLGNGGGAHAKEDWKAWESPRPQRDSILWITSASCHHSKALLTHAHSIGPCSWHGTGITRGIILEGLVTLRKESQDSITT